MEEDVFQVHPILYLDWNNKVFTCFTQSSCEWLPRTAQRRYDPNNSLFLQPKQSRLVATDTHVPIRLWAVIPNNNNFAGGKQSHLSCMKLTPLLEGKDKGGDIDCFCTRVCFMFWLLLYASEIWPISPLSGELHSQFKHRSRNHTTVFWSDKHIKNVSAHHRKISAQITLFPLHIIIIVIICTVSAMGQLLSIFRPGTNLQNSVEISSMTSIN